jgi:hypothetical protein
MLPGIMHGTGIIMESMSQLSASRIQTKVGVIAVVGATSCAALFLMSALPGPSETNSALSAPDKSPKKAHEVCSSSPGSGKGSW